MMNAKKNTKWIALISLVVAALLCLTGFGAASVMSITGTQNAESDALQNPEELQDMLLEWDNLEKTQMPNSSPTTQDKERYMTLDDVRQLSKRGDTLSPDDFAAFDSEPSIDTNGEHWYIPISGGKWELEVISNFVDGTELLTTCILIPSGFEFRPQNWIEIRKGGVDEYIKYVEMYDGTQTLLTDSEEAAAHATALDYETRIFGDKIDSITRISDVSEYMGAVIVNRIKGKFSGFYVTVDANPPRMTVLTQSDNDTWEVINEGLATRNDTPLIPYTSLVYDGLDVNPQHYMSSYVVDDPDFIVDVWDIIGFDSRTERSGGSTAVVVISLTFYSDDSMLNLKIDPNDVGEHTRDRDTIYYDLPAGTYERLSRALTDYTTVHFNETPDIETVRSFAADNERVTFAKGSEILSISTTDTGDFIADWELDKWTSYVPENGARLTDSILIQDDLVDITVGVDNGERVAWVNYKGQSAFFSIPGSALETIRRQFGEYQLISALR